MSQKYKINEELAAVEATLASLQPVAAGIDRDLVMFAAGKAAARSSVTRSNRYTRWLWPLATAASLALALGFGLFFVLGCPHGEKQIIYVQTNRGESDAKLSQKLWYEDRKNGIAATEHPPRQLNVTGMDPLAIQNLVASQGIDALPWPDFQPLAPGETPLKRPGIFSPWEMFPNDE